MELFKLFGTIAVNNAEANSAIDETDSKASGFSDKLKGGIGTAAKWGTAIAGGATAAVGGLTKFAESSASTADHVDKMSQKIGVSRQTYQELDFICSQSGTSVDSLQMGMKSLTSAMDGAKSGTKSNVEQFERLGVAVTNSDGTFRSQEDVMWDTLSALQSMEDQTEKSRLATELFGRSGTELMPLLNGASGSIEDMKKQANDLGLVLNDEIIDNGVNLTDSLDQTKRAFGSIVTQLGASLMPIVEKASDYIQKSLPSIQQLMNRLVPVITSLFENLLPPLMDLAEEIFPILMDLIEKLIPPISQIMQAILPVITDLITMLLPPITQIVQMILPLLVSLIEPLLPLLEPILNLLQPFIDLLVTLLEPLVELLNLILPPLIEIITTVIQGVLSVLQPIIEWLADFLGNVLGGVISGITDLIGWCADGFKAAWEGIKSAWSTVTDFFSGIWDGISGAFSSVGDFFSDKFTKAKEGIHNAFSNIGGFFKGVWSQTKENFKNVKEFFSDKFSKARDGIKNAFSNIGDFFGNVWSKTKSTFKNTKEFFSNKFSQARDGIKNAFSNIGGFFSNVWSKTKDSFKNTKEFFSTKFSQARDGMKNAFSNVGNIFSSIWDKIKKPFIKVGSFFSDIFSGAWNGIKSIFSGVGDFFSGVFNRIVDVVKTPINWIISGINFLINGLNKISFDIPDWVPGIGGSTFGINIPNIPELAEGGVLKKGQTGYLEGDGDEAVVPLEKNTGWISRVAEQINKFSIETKSNIEGAVDVDKLSSTIKSDIGTRIDEVNDKFDKLIELIIRYFPEFSKSKGWKMVLDDDTLVGKLTPKINSELNELREREDVVFI